MSRTWSKFDEKSLAKFVIPDARRWVRLDMNRADLLAQADGRRKIVEGLYAELRQKGIRYAPEQYQPELAQQVIRSPTDILDIPGEGTCLDLATLFAGICLGYELIPVIVVTDVHALCLVSMTHGAPEWDAFTRNDRVIFDDLVTDSHELIDLVDGGSFIAVECTGFAHSETLPEDSIEGNGRHNGFLPFLKALEAGRAQLDRADSPLRFAFDATVAQYHWKIEPPRIDPDLEIATEVLVASRVAAGLRLGRSDREVAMKPYPRPVEPMMRPAVGFVDRRDEVAASARSVDRSEICWLTGERGVGKTTILRRLANEDRLPGFTDGVVHLRDVLDGDDASQHVLDAFFETGGSFKPSRTKIGQALRGLKAMILVDDVSSEVLESLADLMPSSGFVAASSASPGSGSVVALKGLTTAHAAELFEANLGRDLNNDERDSVGALCESLGGHPGRVIDAARAAASGDSSIAQLLASARSSPTGPSRTRFEGLSEAGQLIVDLTRLFDRSGLHRKHLEGMVPGETEAILSRLASERVVETSSPRYRLAATWMGGTVDDRHLESARSMATRYFTDFADHASVEEAASSLPELTEVMRWSVEAKDWAAVVALGRLAESVAALTRQWGVWGLVLSWLRDAATEAGDQATHALALHQLGTRARLLGDRRAAKRFLKAARKERRSIGDTEAARLSKHNLGFARAGWVLWVVGAVIAAGVGVGVVCATTDVCSASPPGDIVVEIDPGEVRFEDQSVGGGGESRSVRIINRGDTPAVLDRARIDGSGGFTIVGDDCPDVLGAGFGCEYSVAFVPETAGSYEALFALDVDGSGSLTSVLTGVALEPADVIIEPAVGRFGEVTVGDVVERTFVISNRGQEQALVGEPGVEGDFYFLLDHDCGRPIKAGGSCSVTVAMTPDRDPAEGVEDRSEMGLLIVETDPSGTITVPLQATSVFVLPDLTIELVEATPLGRQLIGGSDIVVIRVEAVVRNGGRGGANRTRTTAEAQSNGAWFQTGLTVDHNVTGFDIVIEAEIPPGAEQVLSGFILRPRSSVEDTSAPLPVRLVVDSCAGLEFVEEHCSSLESDEDNNFSNEIDVNPRVGETEVRLERTDGEVPYATYRDPNSARLVADALSWFGQASAEEQGLERPHTFIDAATVIPPTDDGRLDIPEGGIFMMDLVDLAPGWPIVFVKAMSANDVLTLFDTGTSQSHTPAFPQVPRGSFLEWCDSGPPWTTDLIIEGEQIVKASEPATERAFPVVTTLSMVDGSNGFFIPSEITPPSMVEILRLYIEDVLGGFVTEEEYPLVEGRIAEVFCGIQ